MARKPARSRGYVVTVPAAAIYPVRAPVGPYPGAAAGGGNVGGGGKLDFSDPANSNLIV